MSRIAAAAEGLPRRASSRPQARLLAAALVLALALAAPADGGGARTPRAIVLDGRPTFPVALARGPGRDARTPWGTSALAEVARAGITTVKVGPTSGTWTQAAVRSVTAWNGRARAHGLRTWIELGDLARAAPGTPAAARLARVVGTLVDDPSGSAIGFWKAPDEPLVNLVHPTALRYPYCRVTGRGDPTWCRGAEPLDPAHLWVTIQAPKGSRTALARYAAVTDVHGVDVFPVTTRRGDLHAVGRRTRLMAEVSAGAPVWTTLETCRSGTMPTRAQERFMLYDAIVNGARGVAFYGGQFPGCWTARDARAGWNWTFWRRVLRGLVAEVGAHSALAPALAGSEAPTPITTGDRTTQALGRLGPTGELWVIAAHDGADEARVTIAGLPRSATSAKVYAEGRSVRVGNGRLTDDFDGYGVHVYRLTRA